jgi:hypothetical protein
MWPMPTSAVLTHDTSDAAERMQVELWRRMSPSEKLRLVAALNRAVEALALRGIRLRHPGASDHECMLRLAILKLGRRLACRVYPEASGLPGF